MTQKEKEYLISCEGIDDVCYICDGCGWIYFTQDQPPSGEGEQLCPDCCEDDEEDEEGEEF